MALTHGKQLYFHFNKCGKRNLFPALGNNSLNFLSVVRYSDTTQSSKSKLNKIMRMHLEKAEKYDKFLKEQMAEYELGKKFLANMMGQKTENMTEKDVDEAIEYLFPSALYVPKARPMMKPPGLIFARKKEAEFDGTGRPFHFLFYTSRPNYCQCLHDAASTLENLNKEMGKRNPPPKPLFLPAGRWPRKEELEKLFFEKLYDVEYEKFLLVFERLTQHPFASLVEDFIKKYWKSEEQSFEMMIPEPEVDENNVKIFKIEGYDHNS